MAKMNKIKAIIFDLGNVIANYDHMIAAKKMSNAVGIPATFIKRIILEEKNLNPLEKGTLSEKEFWTRIEKGIDRKIDSKLFDRLWEDIFSPNKNMEKLVGLLKKRYRLALLSNMIPVQRDHLCKRFKIIKTFDVVIFSFEVGLRKPEKGIYKLALRRLRTRPEETLYFDDNLEFVRAARKLGINAFQFKSASQLKKILKKFNITV